MQSRRDDESVPEPQGLEDLLEWLPESGLQRIEMLGRQLPEVAAVREGLPQVERWFKELGSAKLLYKNPAKRSAVLTAFRKAWPISEEPAWSTLIRRLHEWINADLKERELGNIRLVLRRFGARTGMLELLRDTFTAVAGEAASGRADRSALMRAMPDLEKAEIDSQAIDETLRRLPVHVLVRVRRQLDQITRSQARWMSHWRGEVEEHQHAVADPSPGPLAAAEREDERGLLMEAIAKLSPPRAFLLRMYLNGLTFEQIASALDVSVSTVSRRYADILREVSRHIDAQ